ncbi:MAG: hypothetical protein IIZ15_00785, partial [Coriobacteriales bacterium]|nr:hypothetical protein [Coriobacteriales bacterium]
LVENICPSPESKMDMKFNDVLVDMMETQANVMKADAAGVAGEARTEIILSGSTANAVETQQIIGVLNSLADTVAKLSSRLDALEQRQQPKQQQPQQQTRKRKRKRNRKGQQGQSQNQTP